MFLWFFGILQTFNLLIIGFVVYKTNSDTNKAINDAKNIAETTSKSITDLYLSKYNENFIELETHGKRMVKILEIQTIIKPLETEKVYFLSQLEFFEFETLKNKIELNKANITDYLKYIKLLKKSHIMESNSNILIPNDNGNTNGNGNTNKNDTTSATATELFIYNELKQYGYNDFEEFYKERQKPLLVRDKNVEGILLGTILGLGVAVIIYNAKNIKI